MLTYIQIKLSGVGLGFASFLGGVGIGAGAASKKTQINLKINKPLQGMAPTSSRIALLMLSVKLSVKLSASFFCFLLNCSSFKLLLF